MHPVSKSNQAQQREHHEQETDRPIDYRHCFNHQREHCRRADSDQINERNPLDEMVKDEPIHSAESAQSITDSDLQTRQQNNDQAIQHNKHAAVVDTERKRNASIPWKTRNPLFQSYGTY